MTKPHDILKQYWGYDSFRPVQQEIITSVLEGKDTLALLPTGGGKSICFQVPGLLLEGICLVVSPLVALMNDQVYQLKKRGISAVALFAGMPHREMDILLENCVLGKVKFLYVSPERLKSELFVARLEQMNVSLLAIDEAHCISQWGYDFRPSYAEIASIYELMPHVKKIALTATATKGVKEDIVEHLEFESTAIFTKSFARKNLSYSVFDMENKGAKLLEILNNVQGSGIVYVRSRKETENVAKFLYQNGISSDFYHAGLPQETRGKKQEDWIKGIRRVMVCTNAFGMGIDKPDVRTVVHLDLPDSLEAYYQEAGRAGRDERSAFAVLLTNSADVFKLRRSEENRNPAYDFVQRVYQGIANYFKLATGSSEWQSFDFDIKEFSHNYNLNPIEVLYAVKKLQEMGVLLFNEYNNRPSAVKFMVNNNELYRYSVANAGLEPVIKALLRLYGGNMYSEFMYVSEFEIAKHASMGKTEATKKLRQLAECNLIIYDPIKVKPQLTYTTPRLEQSKLKKPYEAVVPRQKVVREKIETIISYAQKNKQCRTRIFQEYFDEETYLNCGVCDVCIKAKKEVRFEEDLLLAKDEILVVLEKGKAITVSSLKEQMTSANDFLITETIRQLMDEDVVYLSETQELFLVPR
ncbi:MAG: RecQ family ATP-dependent DNA helicase [Reichenbachiella sp.]